MDEKLNDETQQWIAKKLKTDDAFKKKYVQTIIKETKDDVTRQLYERYFGGDAWDDIERSKRLYNQIRSLNDKWTTSVRSAVRKLIKELYPKWHRSVVEMAIRETKRLLFCKHEEDNDAAIWYEVIQKWCPKENFGRETE